MSGKTPHKRSRLRSTKATTQVMADPQPSASADAEISAPKTPGGKLGQLTALMRRPEGATMADMIALTGWKEHSVRGALAGTFKKRLGLPVTSEKTEGASARVYRIE